MAPVIFSDITPGKEDFAIQQASKLYDAMEQSSSWDLDRSLFGYLSGQIEDEEIFVNSDARIRVPRLAPRRVRYQVARFCTWDGHDDRVYKYSINPRSLARAKQGGLRVEHMLNLLHKYANAVPPSLVKALERWDAQGTEARIEQTIILLA